MPGKGKTITTGKLGDVMKESIAGRAVGRAQRARSSSASRTDFYQKTDIHIHLPEGATPKDGPSAGIAIATAMVSVLTGIPVRCDVAMTGEITLRGEVLPIGGLKEKLLAAHRGGIKTVLIPEENVKDLVEIPDEIKNRLEILPVKWIDEVLERRARAPARAAARAPTRRRRSRRSPTTRPEPSPRIRRIAGRPPGESEQGDLIEQIAQAAEISKSAAERAVDALVGAVKIEPAQGRDGHAGRLRHLLRRQARRRAPGATRAPARRSNQGRAPSQVPCWQGPQGRDKLAPLFAQHRWSAYRGA